MKKAPLLIVLVVLVVVMGVFLVVRFSPSKIPAQSPVPSPVPIPPPTPAPAPKPAPVSPEFAIKLAETFAPIIYLKGEGAATESYEPKPIEIFVDDAVVRDIQNPGFSAKASLADLPQWSKSVYYLDLANLAPQSPTDYRLTYDQLKGRYQPTLYVRVREAVEGYTTVQYWLFYYANDWRNFHEGDWELIQLHFPPETSRKLLEEQTQPVFIALSQHQFGQQMAWSDMVAKSLVEGTHPVVYVARGSHANYFLPGNSWALLDFDDTGVSSWQMIRPEQFRVVLLPGEGEERAGLDWMDFRGRWGEYLGLSLSVLGLSFTQAGPFGPLWADGEKTSGKWENPVKWASGLPRYPDPFWRGFLKMLPDPSKLAIFSIFSPAELHVYDAQGRHVGLAPTGQVETEIPGAIYIEVEGADYKTVIIPNADVAEQYRVEAKGTGTGKMDLKAVVPDVNQAIKRFLEYVNVPITPTTTARASVKPVPVPLVAAPPVAPPGVRVVRPETVRDETTELEVDGDGDGEFELKKGPGDFEKQEERRSGGRQPSPTPTPAPEEVPVPDFHVARIVEKAGNDYVAEVRDAASEITVKVTLKYAPDFARARIGETPLAGAQRAVPVVGETFEIKGTLRLKEEVLEIISWKQDPSLEKVFRRYVEALSLVKKAGQQAREARLKYNAIFDGLSPDKCVYRESPAVPVSPPAVPPQYSGPVPIPPELLAREVETGISVITGQKTTLESLVNEISRLRVQDCRDELKEFKEDRNSPTNLVARLSSPLSGIEATLNRLRELLEQVMAD